MIYTINLRDPAGLFPGEFVRDAQQGHPLRLELVRRSNSTKFMNYLNTVNTTIQAPITTVTSAYGLRNIIRGTGAVPSVFTTGGTTVVAPTATP